ncbi:MAG: fimbria major subunit, partial [Muribaculaceae bacterium]|nr:fimbria major subunit [Muribaculaceae bacterium]
MNNVAQTVRSLPRTLNDWNAYKTAATAFNLSGMNAEGQDVEVDNRNGRGAIKVERSCARFDFKDGSPVGNNTYNVVLDSDKKTLIQIRLNKIFFTNLAKQFYYLPRVSDNGLNEGAVICGEETPENYVVGPFATEFNKDDITTSFKFNDYFQYSFFNNNWGYNNANWDKYLISDVLEEDENFKGTEENNKDLYMNHQYHIWRYATENVIPSDVDNQIYGRTSIIVFKGKMVATEDALNSSDPDTKEMAEYMNNVGGDKLSDTQKDPILYSFRNSLYFKWEGVQKSAIKDAITMTDNRPKTIGTYEEDGVEYLIVDPTTISRTSSLYIAVFGKRIKGEDKAGAIGKFQWGTTWYIDDPEKTLEGDITVLTNSANVIWSNWNNAGRPNNDLLSSMRKAITDAGFTIYQTSEDKEDGGWGYYCYYYYRNRHNDNNDNGVMGPMEFAVVRNNVYKLAVTEISQLGHPRIPENDPDKPTPNTP